MTEMLRIQVSTLNEIIDALNASKFVTVRIRMSPLNDEENIIAKKILEKVADEIRECDGTTEKIPINELATRIYNIVRKIQLATPIIDIYEDIFIETKQLATPIIALYDDDVLIEPDSPPAENNTSAVLGVAILGMAILGSGSDDGGATDELKREQLKTSIIAIYDDRVKQLATPIIYLFDDA